MSLLTNDAQTRLLFKQFMGVASTALEAPFDAETFNFVPNIFSKDVMIETIPDTPTITINDLDGSGPFNKDDGTILPDLSGGYWLDSSSNYTINSVEESTYFNSTNSTYNGKTYAEIFPDENIKFFKRLSLVPVDSASNGRVWGSFSDYSGSVIANKNSILEHAIPFKFDDINEGYLPIVRKNNATPPSTNFQQVFLNQFPVYWLMDSGSGYLLFYAEKTDLESNNINASETLSNGVQDPKYAPTISCFVYNGKLGITNIDVSGQQQVADLSGVLGSMPGVDRMLLPDGSANIFDLCGNDAIRSQYKYVRKNLFVGYSDMPFGGGTTPLPVIIVDDVSHNFDPSHIDASGDTITYEFDVSGRAHFSGPIVQNGDSGSSAFGLYSASFGTDTKARKQGCFSQGNTTDASGQYSHAEGQLTLADGAHSHSEGSYTKSYGIGSHAEGISGESWGSYSHASGQYTIIGTDYGTSIGKFNDTSENVLFVIGDGTSDSDRRDAFYVSTAGNTRVGGNLDVSKNVDISGTLDVLGQTNLHQTFVSGNLSVSGVADVNNIYLHQDMSMNGGQIKHIGDATDPSGVPSWGQVQQYSGAGGAWAFSGDDIYNTNIGNVGISKNVDISGTLDVSGQTNLHQTFVSGNLSVSGVADVNNIYLHQDMSMNGGQIKHIGDATDPSGVPSWGQVQQYSGAGGAWAFSGDDIYNTNIGNVGISKVNPITELDVSGSTSIAHSDTLSSIDIDKHLYVRNTNLIDTLKIGFNTFFKDIWKNMLDQNIAQGNNGDALATPTFTSGYGPSLIPIAYINIQQNNGPNPPPPPPDLQQRPHIANSLAYFTIKFAQPVDTKNLPQVPIDWKTAQLTNKKSFLGAITQQTIHFVAGYIDNYLDIQREGRNPKPFIKILSTNIINQKCLTGNTDNIADTTNDNVNGPFTVYNQISAFTPKIGGISRIVIAEGLPDPYADKDIQNKVWLCLEQTWNDEPWQSPGAANITNEEALTDIVGEHIIDVKMYQNNTGNLDNDRNPNSPITNTDWQLVRENDIKFNEKYSSNKFILPMGQNTNSPPGLFGKIQPNIQNVYTLQVGETKVLGTYPDIKSESRLWQTQLILKDWAYGITTTDEIFMKDVDICGNLNVQGNFNVDNSGVFTNIIVTNRGTFGPTGSILVGPTTSTFTGITNIGPLDNGTNDISCGNIYVGNGGSNGSNMSTQIIPRTDVSIVIDKNYHTNPDTFEYYKLATINTETSQLRLNSPSGFFEINYYQTSTSLNGGGKSALMQTVRFIAGATTRKNGITTFCDNIYIDVLSNQYQGPNVSDIKIKELVISCNDANEIILYGLIYRPANGAGTARYTMKLYQSSSDIDLPHDDNSKWKFIYGSNAIQAGGLPNSNIAGEYKINLESVSPDLYSNTTAPLDNMKMRYEDTSANKLINSNVKYSRPTFFEQYVKFGKGIDISNTKIINARGLLGKNQYVIGNNVGSTPNSNDMHIESLGVDSNINIKVRPNKKITFIGRDDGDGTESGNSIDIYPKANSVIDMDFNGTNNIINVNNLNVDGLITGVAGTTFVEYRDFSVDIPANNGDGWHCIATTLDTNNTGGSDSARGLFIVDDDTAGLRQQIIFYAGTSFSEGNYINVLAHNWYNNPLNTNLRIDVNSIYNGSNLYLYRKDSSTTSDIHIRLYQNGRISTTGGRWVLTSTPKTGLNTIAVNLDISYDPNNGQANACSSLNHSFQGDVSMNSLSLGNLDVENTITTKILEVENSGGNDLLKVDGPNKTTTFNFDSGIANPGYLILKDTNSNDSTFIKQQGTTVVLEGSDLQVGAVGVEKDINAAEVTGWFNTKDYYAVAKVVGVDSGGGMPQPLYMSMITNNCPGSIQLIPTTTTNFVQPQATGVYTVTITGVWTGTGNGWNDNSDTGQPMILMYGPAYHSSAPGGIAQTQMLSLQSSSRFYNSGYTDYLTFNWTGRMVHLYNSAQAQYSFYCKENGGGSSGTQTYTGQIQVTRIC